MTPTDAQWHHILAEFSNDDWRKAYGGTGDTMTSTGTQIVERLRALQELSESDKPFSYNKDIFRCAADEIERLTAAAVETKNDLVLEYAQTARRLEDVSCEQQNEIERLKKKIATLTAAAEGYDRRWERSMWEQTRHTIECCAQELDEFGYYSAAARIRARKDKP